LEAQTAIDELKKKGGVAQGSVWFLEREMVEARKYLPQSKGGIARK